MAFHGLAPGLLLAAPRLGDPNFERSVVLLGRHEEGGALGWVVNGQTVAPVGELLESAELVPEGVVLPATQAFSRPARVGGPVSPQSGWILYSRRERSFTREIDVGSDLALCNDPEALEAVMRGEAPFDFQLLLGYAGWGAGQLEAELKEGSWLPGALDPAMILRTSPESLWDVAFRAATGAAPELVNVKSWGSA